MSQAEGYREYADPQREPQDIVGKLDLQIPDFSRRSQGWSN
jgi:hypothetical protein